MAETNLATLIGSMQPRLVPGSWVFVAVPTGSSLPSDLAPIMTFQEAEGTTLILPSERVSAAGLTADFPCRMITLDINSGLEAVGFLAAITARLAAAGIAVNPVSAFHHDHLFVPESCAAEAMAILTGMSEGEN